jgi:hypothetical protein
VNTHVPLFAFSLLRASGIPGNLCSAGGKFPHAALTISHNPGQDVHLTALTVAERRPGHLERLVLTSCSMVRLTVGLNAPSARRVHDLLEALRFLMAATRLEPGCQGCSAWADPDSTVHYVEDWMTEADARRRVRSLRFTSLLGLLESAPEPPQVQFDFVSKTRGLDYVAEVRGQALT